MRAGLLGDVAGTLALDGTLAWGAGDEITADLALLLEELAFTAGPARFSQVNGVVEIDRLWPLDDAARAAARDRPARPRPAADPRARSAFELLPEQRARGRAAALGLRRRHGPRRAVQGRFSGL